MSFNSYSKALYELSIESNVTDEIEHQSKSILKALETIKEFNAFIKNPLFKQNDHVEMLNDLSKKFNFNPILNKFLNFLTSHQIKEKFSFSFGWKKGDIALWSNRSMLHAATAFNGDRKMFRITVQ